MALIWFIGDEVTATGFRLAGARVTVAEPGRETRLLQEAREAADLVLVTAEVARTIPERVLRDAFKSEKPLVLVVPDARWRVEPPDLAAGLRRQLGLSE